jgi:hypothetical protein
MPRVRREGRTAATTPESDIKYTTIRGETVRRKNAVGGNGRKTGTKAPGGNTGKGEKQVQKRRMAGGNSLPQISPDLKK